MLNVTGSCKPLYYLGSPVVNLALSQTKKRELDRARDKTRANLGAAFQRWRALRDLKGFRSDAELATFLLDRFYYMLGKGGVREGCSVGCILQPH
uniref:Uncharacterized protein n=1 Tax=Pygocentrus nattereri TaxID=42514 RepID=A0AAR2IKQ5_PYGNA